MSVSKTSEASEKNCFNCVKYIYCPAMQKGTDVKKCFKAKNEKDYKNDNR